MSIETIGPDKQALNLRLYLGTIQRLKLNAMRTGESVSDLVEKLVAEHLPDVEITVVSKPSASRLRQA